MASFYITIGISMVYLFDLNIPKSECMNALDAILCELPMACMLSTK